MCGIFGIFATKPKFKVQDLIDGLHALEYRGYDSAGIAFVKENNIVIQKQTGQVAALETEAKKYLNTPIYLGIAHTRWATHGNVNIPNTHPHIGITTNIALVHNGIIENYLQLKEEIKQQANVQFKSQTDTEVVAKYLELQLKNTKNLLSAWENTLNKLKGSWAFAVVVKHLDSFYLLFAKNQSPLVIAKNKDTILLASDPVPLAKYSTNFIFLEDNTYGIISKQKSTLDFRIYKNNKPYTPKIKRIKNAFEVADKKGFNTYMEKEIFEQPTAIANTLNYHLDNKKLEKASKLLTQAILNKELFFTACGTSYNAGTIASALITELTGNYIPTILASEFRYTNLNLNKNSVIIAISQSGETADLIQALKKAKKSGAKIISIVNVPFSTIDRLADITLYTKAGPEIGVASTKAFTSQLTVLYLLILFATKKQTKYINTLKQLPNLVDMILSNTEPIKNLAKKVKNYNNMLYLGRKLNFFVANEGALKIKEIAYIHAEAYTSGAMKHGPIALIDKNFLSLHVMPKDGLFDKSFSNLQEIIARNGPSIVLTSKDAQKEFKNLKLKGIITIPTIKEPIFYPFLSIIPLQLLALYVAELKKLNVDKPRNLAKSVTVE